MLVLQHRSKTGGTMSETNVRSTVATDWFTKARTQIERTLGNPEDKFPCFFARNAYARGNICFATVPRAPNTTYDFAEMQFGLDQYLERSSVWDGSINSAEPLLMVFEPDFEHVYNASRFIDLGNKALQFLIDNDKCPWPDHVPKKFDDPYWSFCYRGVPLFVNFSHPAHFLRRSRKLCDALTLVINPRERFDQVASIHDTAGVCAREKIRDNINHYDLINHSPLLGHYQQGDSEWNQYALPDTNHDEPATCPLTHWDRTKVY